MEPRAVNKFISPKTVIIASLILLSALIVFLVAIKQNQDVRNKAAVPNGPAQYILTPASSSIPSGSPFTVTLSVDTQNLPVDGFQVVTKFSGTIPSNLAFDPVVPQGLKTIRNTIRDNGPDKIHELILITADPSSPPFLSNSIVSLGRYTMIAPSSGSLTVSFDTNLSKVLQNGVAQDILRYPEAQTYTFVPKSTYTPTPTFTPTPTPTPVQNLLRNGSFEIDNDKNSIPDFWKRNNFTKNDRLTSEVANTGAYSMRFDLAKETKKLTQTVKGNWKAGNLMSISGFVRSQIVPVSGIRQLIVVTKYADKSTSKYILDLPISTANFWTISKGYIKLPKEARQFAVTLVVSKTSQISFVDDVVLAVETLSVQTKPNSSQLSPQSVTKDDIVD
ncbi:hypothetical protein HY409_01860 [Candidatus Gottesmanbacteria bacterium]|nr:hypothetical protein [Candidatus Gottesmanbacteria bacterium]